MAITSTTLPNPTLQSHTQDLTLNRGASRIELWGQGMFVWGLTNHGSPIKEFSIPWLIIVPISLRVPPVHKQFNKQEVACVLWFKDERGIGGSCHVVDSVRKEKERLTAVSTSKQRFGDSSSTIPTLTLTTIHHPCWRRDWVMVKRMVEKRRAPSQTSIHIQAVRWLRLEVACVC